MFFRLMARHCCVLFPMDEAPTGILLDGDKAYVTTFGTTGHLQILSLESGRVEASIPTGSGACHPMFGPDKSIYMYVTSSGLRSPKSIRLRGR